MYDNEGDEVENRLDARQLGVQFSDGAVALLRLHPDSQLEKVERH
jgi:hypothetical protein